MQISHIVRQGANIEMVPDFWKSARLNGQVSAPKSHLGAKLWNNDFIINLSLKKFLDNLTY